MTRTILFLVTAVIVLALAGCAPPLTSNDSQRDQQNKILDEATAQTGMPNIKNFRERKMMKDILELRDQTGLVTYTYLFSELRGCLVPLGNSVGYPIPYATQYTAPETMQTYNLDPKGGSQRYYGAEKLPQADPNGLFSPSNADATWSMMKDPHSSKTGVIYSEPKLITMPFKAPDEIMCPPPK